MGTQKNRLADMILFSAHNIGLEGQLRILEHAKCPLSIALGLIQDTELSVYFNPFPHTTILQQTTLKVFCQTIENLYN